mmetsp:Transcript_9744/g.18942  ORF Transcript_9744/g.18942 Transcript_9744/m.18942 type:complete len:221 (+) Transcript_9744:327-989(+)
MPPCPPARPSLRATPRPSRRPPRARSPRARSSSRRRRARRLPRTRSGAWRRRERTWTPSLTRWTEVRLPRRPPPARSTPSAPPSTSRLRPRTRTPPFAARSTSRPRCMFPRSSWTRSSTLPPRTRLPSPSPLSSPPPPSRRRRPSRWTSARRLQRTRCWSVTTRRPSRLPRLTPHLSSQSSVSPKSPPLRSRTRPPSPSPQRLREQSPSRLLWGAGRSLT